MTSVSRRPPLVEATGEQGRRPSWDDVYTRTETPVRMMRWATTHAPMVLPLTKCRRVLEVGTGTGMLSAFLAQCRVEVTTIDVSSAVLDVAERFYRSTDVRVARVDGDGTAMPFPDDAFDAVFSQGLWEHFDDAYIQRFAIEGLRVAPVVYASVPSVFYPRIGRTGPGLVGNERFMSSRRWRRALGSLGRGAALDLYADWKILTVIGATLPYPNNLLITLQRP